MHLIKSNLLDSGINNMTLCFKYEKKDVHARFVVLCK